MNATLLSLQIGTPAIHGTEGSSNPLTKPQLTAFYKKPVTGPVQILAETLEGDGVGNRKVHGGPDKAICAYPSEHYTHWQQSLTLLAKEPFGAFGENFTTQGLLETEVCVGDIFSLGTALLQISQPRQPCYTLARRWQLKNFPVLVDAAGFTGWYFRVLQTGVVHTGDTFTRQEQPLPQWTIARANNVMQEREPSLEALEELAHCPLLADAWRRPLQQMLYQRKN
ncbi:MOSC domain-containing protein [soil metagenome]